MILLVEDNPGDGVLFRVACRASGWAVELLLVGSGEEALKALVADTGSWQSGLRGESGPGARARIQLAVVDLRLAGTDGWIVLEAIAREPGRMPRAAVLTSSARDDDRARALSLGVRDYFMKPVGMAAYAPIIEALRALYEGKNHAH